MEIHRAETDEIANEKYDATADADQLMVDQAVGLAEKHGVRRVHIALEWLLHKEPITSPIVGATKASQLEDAEAALSMSLTPEEIAFLEEPYVPHQSLVIFKVRRSDEPVLTS